MTLEYNACLHHTLSIDGKLGGEGSAEVFYHSQEVLEISWDGLGFQELMLVLCRMRNKINLD